MRPNFLDSEAVEARKEIDLRIGAAFTRFQTMRIKSKFHGFKKEQPISYGPCQFPTLGFVVERYSRVKAFIPQQYWYISCNYKQDKAHADFTWRRGRLYDKMCCLVLYEHCMDNPEATVLGIQKRQTRK